MRRVLPFLAFVFSLQLAAIAQQPQQTAREALLDMFFGKPGSFEKHLPNATLAALREVSGGDDSALQQVSMITALMKAQGRLQTFETGPTLLVYEDERKLARFEVLVKENNLRGTEDEIIVTFAAYKDGQAQNLQIFPQLSFLMKSEQGIWRLNELAATVRVPLANPELLKEMVESIKKQQALRAGTGITRTFSESTTSWQSTANEPSAIASMRTILTAEIAYSSQYSNVGFTCSLSDLDGFGQGTPNEHQAMLIESRLASGKKQGYVFTLTRCAGTPSTHFALTAVPSVLGSGRTFCTDESGVIKSSDGQANCLNAGKSLQ